MTTRCRCCPAEFADMVRAIREVEASMGIGGERRPSQGEIMEPHHLLAKSLIATRRLGAG